MSNIKRASLEQILEMRKAGSLKETDWNAEPGPDLPDDFWENAVVMNPEDWEKRSVHLKLDRDVFDYFKAGGKGHLTRMQNVLRAYVKAQTRS